MALLNFPVYHNAAMKWSSNFRKQAYVAGLLIILGLTVVVADVQATVMRYLAIEELTRLSAEVISGQVISTRTHWDEGHQRIYTTVRVQVSESFKGNSKRGQIVTITQLGGELDGMRLDYAGRPTFTVNEQVVLFTRPGKNNLPTVVGLKQGKLQLVGNEVRRDFSGISLIDAELPAVTRPGTSTGRSKTALQVAQTHLSLDELRQRIAQTR